MRCLRWIIRSFERTSSLVTNSIAFSRIIANFTANSVEKLVVTSIARRDDLTRKHQAAMSESAIFAIENISIR